MAIPAKPTARLAEDNVFGQKTRDAACYWAQADRVTVGTSIAGMGSPFLRRWQEMLNRALRGLQELPQLNVPGSTNARPSPGVVMDDGPGAVRPRAPISARTRPTRGGAARPPAARHSAAWWPGRRGRGAAAR